MKIRTGFVSNSSSSNFVVDNTYETVFDLAKAMLKIRDRDWSSTQKDLIEIEEIHKAIRNGKDPNTSIHFDSCNYDTFIKKLKNYYIVTTCNNHLFRDNMEGVITAPKEVYKWLKDNNYLYEDSKCDYFDEDIETWDFQCGEIFWSPKYDLELSKYDYMKGVSLGKKIEPFCKDKNHFSEKFILASTKEIICPTCYFKKMEDAQQKIDSRFDILDLED